MNIKEVIKKHTSVEIPIENITHKNGVISLSKTNPMVLSLIYIKKSKILNDLGSLGLKITDIR